MTDRQLAEQLGTFTAIEAAQREAIASGDAEEHEAARTAHRQTVSARMAVERWILLRAMRAALQE